MSGKFQVVFGVTKIAAVGAIIGITLTGFSTGNVSNFTNPFWPESFGWPTILAIGAALRYSFFAFSGWEGATSVSYTHSPSPRDRTRSRMPSSA